jgi:GH15 family glucan-1,4-alpha-glucosidase
VVYTVFGNSNLTEKKIDWLDGYRNSKPVRIGNGAHNQLQLDVYGEVLDAVFSYSKLVDQFSSNSRKFIIGLGEAICRLWNQPDNGIWEVRSPAHHTHSKVMAWVGLDSLIKVAKKYNWKKAPVNQFEAVKEAIKKEIEEFGYNEQINSFTRVLKGSALDASSLVYSLVGYCEASSQRMISTTQRLTETLTKNKLLYRYIIEDDGFAGNEGSFGICNFWLVENLAKSGKLTEAVATFELMLDHASPTGLFSEEIDPFSHELLGNYPQSFTHIGLINAAFSIDEAKKQGRQL